jgi:glutaryl-CoA dehydrogenase
MDKLEGVDLFELDELFTEEQRLIRQTVRGFVDKEVMPLVRESFRAGVFPAQLVPRIAELGLLGGNLSGYGCAGLDAISYGLALQELERGDSAVRSFTSVQGGLAMYPIYEFGSEEQKERWLPQMARGEVIGAFALSEPDAGSDPGSMRTTARRDGEGYRLDGTKMWITNGTLAHVTIVWAKTDSSSPESIQAFLVERGTPGFSAHPIKGKFSMRASDTAELVLDGVWVPAANVLPKAHGMKGPLKTLTHARYSIAWAATGAAIACYEAARDHACSRVQFGQPIGSFQLTQAKLVDMLTEIVKAQMINLRLGQLKQAGRVTPLQVSFAKRNNVQSALEIARSARSVLGASGVLDDYPVIRHMLNLETLYTYEGTHEVHTLALGRGITGLNAFSH